MPVVARGGGTSLTGDRQVETLVLAVGPGDREAGPLALQAAVGLDGAVHPFYQRAGHLKSVEDAGHGTVGEAVRGFLPDAVDDQLAVAVGELGAVLRGVAFLH